MKKLMLLLVAFFALQLTVKADDDKKISFDQLPTKAKEFLKKHFTDKKVSISTMDAEMLDKSYKVVFSDGNSVEFDKKGEWKEIECKQSEIPSVLIPRKIKEYVTKNYTNAKIVKMDRDKKNYEVELSDGVELKFDLQYNLVNVDN